MSDSTMPAARATASKPADTVVQKLQRMLPAARTRKPATRR
jgi:hypothetical protein